MNILTILVSRQLGSIHHPTPIKYNLNYSSHFFYIKIIDSRLIKVLLYLKNMCLASPFANVATLNRACVGPAKLLRSAELQPGAFFFPTEQSRQFPLGKREKCRWHYKRVTEPVQIGQGKRPFGEVYSGPIGVRPDCLLGGAGRGFQLWA